MIQSLSLRNFKGHRSTDVALERLTVLVGPNGAGKTSILQALHYMSQLVNTPCADLLKGQREPATLLTRGTTGPIDIEVRGEIDGAGWSTSISLSVDPEDIDESHSWDVKFQWTTAAGTSGERAGEKSFFFRKGTTDPSFWRRLGSAVMFRLDPRKVAAPAYSEHRTPRVEFDGANTAAALAALKLSDDEAFTAVVSTLQKLVPSIKRIRLQPVRVMTSFGRQPEQPGQFTVQNLQVTGHEIVFDFKSAEHLPAHAVSDGTLITLALLTALRTRARANLVLVDDIEQALHPMAQIELMRQLSRLLEQMPDLQIVTTTHSPYVLDAVEASQVIVCFPREDGSIATRRLSEHPDAARVKGTLSAGQLWSLDPEDWVLEGGDAP